MIPDPSPESEGQLIASELPLTSEIDGDDAKDTYLLRVMSGDAHLYISSFSWCAKVRESYFGGGVGGIFAVFLFHIEPRPGIDPWIWVMIGDVPPAYLPIADCKSSAEAFRMYLTGMKKWCELARVGRTGTTEDGVPPVNVPATPEWAEKLSKRLVAIEFALKPFFEPESSTPN